MVSGYVSGRKRNSVIQTGAASHSISQRDHLQFIAATLKPEMMGPSAGPIQAAAAQQQRI